MVEYGWRLPQQIIKRHGTDRKCCLGSAEITHGEVELPDRWATIKVCPEQTPARSPERLGVHLCAQVLTFHFPKKLKGLFPVQLPGRGVFWLVGFCFCCFWKLHFCTDTFHIILIPFYLAFEYELIGVLETWQLNRLYLFPWRLMLIGALFSSVSCLSLVFGEYLFPY